MHPTRAPLFSCRWSSFSHSRAVNGVAPKLWGAGGSCPYIIVVGRRVLPLHYCGGQEGPEKDVLELCPRSFDVFLQVL